MKVNIQQNRVIKRNLNCNKRVVVLGASGQLGQCLKSIVQKNNIQGFSFPDKKTGNILNIESLKKLFELEKPAYIINCAAYTAVDKAEDEFEIADKVNSVGVSNIANLCDEFGCTLIHISTDFVFAGNNPIPLSENDIAEPINVYGVTKLNGERTLQERLNNHFILRTSWLYSEYGNNFLKTMLRLGESNPELRIISDQYGTPTYAMDLAGCILQLIDQESKNYGIYHYSNDGSASWYDFAQAIFCIKGDDAVKVVPIRTHEYPTKAVRPAFSVMDKSKIKKALNIEIPHWRDSLVRCMNALALLNKQEVEIN